jgi:hypothetical protein
MDVEKHLDRPTITLGPLRLWVHGRQFPDATDAWDGNWLWITARCFEHGATVEARGAILDTVSFLHWRQQLSTLYERLEGKAVLESVEPQLRVTVVGRGRTGLMRLRVEITPDHMAQGHWFESDIDQSFLPAVIGRCDDVLSRHPVHRATERGV